MTGTQLVRPQEPWILRARLSDEAFYDKFQGFNRDGITPIVRMLRGQKMTNRGRLFDEES
jgi:hypothetical protein